MIPADVDMDSLHAQLLDDGIAFGTDNPVNSPLEEALRSSLGQTETAPVDPVGVVILETTPTQVADLRDIAQDLAMSTPYETVIVRTPHAASAVSDHLNRHQIETAQRAMAGEPDYPAGLELFLDTAQSTSWNWGLVGIATVVLLMLVAAVSATQARKMSRR
ncbi:hypothetical protein G7Y29_05565 [Corynebacterium qintianiae]|uniref:1-deoxy-D-xylulose-5-phosphate synthase n=1 Tax=Corynebacterium qintianiae TaxID=2709392 RepID=A0A7T0PDP8_9CORY|nr:DUF6676 family protein [Corynebacterium qintianiae]QPK82381.1 hypothetical protein G7Y29_05565 [Corynebacterium qintianiae]